MKKLLFLSLSMSFIAISCSKSGGDDGGGTTESYINTTSGSTWHYQDVDNTDPSAPPDEYLVTSTNRDTTASGKTYHIYTASNGSNVYQGKNGNDYSAFEALPDDLGGVLVDNIYLKAGAAVNATWAQSYNISVMSIPITVNVSNKIIEKGLSKSVLTNNYTNVIHVKTDISLSGTGAAFVTLTTDIHSYYAPNYGLIQRDALLNYTITGSPAQSSSTTTQLKTAILL